MKACNSVMLLLCVAALSLTSCRSRSADNSGTSEDNTQTEDQSQTNPPSTAKEEPSVPEDPIDVLGHRFLTAIQENDIDKYLACWLRIQDVETLIKNPPPDMPVLTEEQLDQMRVYFSKRDEFIRFTFPLLRRAVIDRCGDVATLTNSEVTAHNVSDENGQKGAGSFDVVLSTSDNREVTYHIDDGAFVNERWYFSDRPDTMLTITTADSDSDEIVFFSQYATEEEATRLKQMDAP